MSETQPERTETGEIKDQSPPTSPTTSTTKDATAAPSATTDAKPETKPTLLNEKLAEAKPTEPAKAPDKYDFKVPEGYQLDEKVSAEASELFKGLNIPQEGAQKLVDFYIAKANEAAEAPFKLWQETNEKWQSEVKSDPEIGHKLDEVKTTVARAVDGLGDPKLAADFRAAMDYTGAGNNLAFVKTFYKMAQLLSEGKHVVGSGPAKTGQSAPGFRPSIGAALFPKLPSASQ